jgi:hypothetical protein
MQNTTTVSIPLMIVKINPSAHQKCSTKLKIRLDIWTKVYNKAATVDFEYNVITIGLW